MGRTTPIVSPKASPVLKVLALALVGLTVLFSILPLHYATTALRSEDRLERLAGALLGGGTLVSLVSLVPPPGEWASCACPRRTPCS